jgi:GNAT superfamily N-acetyltransferase
METIVAVDPAATDRSPDAKHQVDPLEPALLRRHAPAAHYALLRDARLAARCSIWTAATPVLDGKAVGVVGHYAAADVAAGVAILRHAIQQLNQRGFATIFGPMDGNTWRRYRLLTDRGDGEPTFFLEPDNPDDWPAHFVAAGFSPIARYFSALNTDLSVSDPRAADAAARLTDTGVTIRSIDPARYRQELTAVHALSLDAFADNFLYTPIALEEFLSMYEPLQTRLRPELILLAEQHGRLVGFMFGVPDFNQAARGQPIDTAIAKSMAVHPNNAGSGLGSVLMDRFQQAALSLGYRRVIHALMHETNRSLRISAHYGRPMRRYTLYAYGQRE